MKRNKTIGLIFFLLIFTLLISTVAIAGPPEDLELPEQGKAYEHARIFLDEPYGQIDYTESISSDYTQKELETAITIGFHIIDVDTTTYPELNTEATLTFNSAFYTNPIILRNGVWEKEIIPTNTAYGEWEIDVEGFSTYQIVESDFTNGTFINTTITELGGGNGITLETDAELIMNFESETITDSSYNAYGFTLAGISKYSEYGGIDYTHGRRTHGNATGITITNSDTDMDPIWEGDFSVALWYKKEGPPINQEVENVTDIIGTETSVGGNAGWKIYTNYVVASDSFRTYFIGHNGTDQMGVSGSVDTKIKDGEWVHITGTIQNGEICLYFNTIEDKCIQYDSTNFSSAQNLMIGDILNANRRSNATIDNIYVFDRVISPKEIETLYYSNQKTGTIVRQLMEPVLQYNFNNRSAYDWSGTDNHGTNLGGSFDTQSGPDKSTSFFVNNQTGIEDSGLIDLGDYDDGFTVSLWFKPEATADSTFQRIFGQENGVAVGQRSFIILTNTQTSPPYQVYSTVYDDANTGHSSSFNFVDDSWHHMVVVYNGSKIHTYIDGERKADSGTSPTTVQKTAAAIRIGNSGRDISQFSGHIDSVMVFNHSIEEPEVIELYNGSQPIYQFQTEGNYTSQIFNSTNVANDAEITSWDYVNLTNYIPIINDNLSFLLPNSKLYVRASNGNESILNEPWTEYTYNGTNHVPDPNPTPMGIYGQYAISMESAGQWGVISDNILEVSMFDFIYTTPYVTALNIEPVPPISTDNILGNATFSMNDTDEGNITIEWFVNNANVFNESFDPLVDNDIAESTLSSAFTIVGDVIYFNATSFNGPLASVTQSSAPVTVQNSPFTLDSWTPADNGSKLNVTEPQEMDFSISITDIDGDVNTTWYLDGDVYSEGLDATFKSLYSTQGTHTFTATATDGTTKESVSWTIEVVNTDVLEWAGPLMFALCMIVLLFGGLLMFLDKTHVVMRLMSFLVLPFMLVALTAFMVRVAEVSGMANITVIFSGLFRGMISLTVFCVAYVIIYFIRAIIETLSQRKDKKENDLIQ
jgi:hypothetical protein